MLPILFSVGSINFYTAGFLLGVGVFLAAFTVWRRLLELGIKEEKIIDFILLAGLFGLLFARVFFVLLNLQTIGVSPLRWFLLGRYPGLSFWGGLIGIFLALFWFSKKQKWDFWQIADEITFGISPFLVLTQLGSFFDGSGGGRPTSMPWGLFFPGSFLRQHPVSLFFALPLFFVWILLLKIERRWRGWDWYKSRANGFIFLVFSALLFFFNFLVAFLRNNQLYFYWAEISLSFLGIIVALLMFYRRSGRKIKEDLHLEK